MDDCIVLIDSILIEQESVNSCYNEISNKSFYFGLFVLVVRRQSAEPFEKNWFAKGTIPAPPHLLRAIFYEASTYIRRQD
jgi:hypothetical protein